MAENFCEICNARGVQSRLVSYQINLAEAILLCEVKECLFPVGCKQLFSQFIVHRKSSEISNSKKKKQPKTTRSQVHEVATPQRAAKEKSVEVFIQWENTNALCWLDSVLSMIVHNQTLRLCLKQSNDISQSLLKTLLERYDFAQEHFASNTEIAARTLKEVRQIVWDYLEPKMRCRLGRNDSPVAALPLLLRENANAGEKLTQEFLWKFRCSVCGYQQTTRSKKILVTFPNVSDDFSMPHGAFVRSCYRCGAQGQKTVIEYEKMPDCVFVHFVEGLRSSSYLEAEFSSKDGSLYTVTQFIHYSKDPDHFSCWSKEHKGTRWLEMNDLKSAKCRWSCDAPSVPASEVHIVVWEKIQPLVEPKKDCLTSTAKVTPEKPRTHLEKTSENCDPNKLTPALRKSCVESNAKKPGIVKATAPLALNNTTLAREQGNTTLSNTSVGVRTNSCDPSADSERGVSLKRKLPKFEPYVPRKQRLLTQSCPNSTQEFAAEKGLEEQPSVKSPLTSKASFLSWQEVEEHSKGVASDDASDSGYSSNPSSVSSSGCQLSVEVRCIDGQTDSCAGTQRVRDLAIELEELLPDCLLDDLAAKPVGPVSPTAKPVGPVNLDTALKTLSVEQDQFLLDLLAN